MEYQRINFMKIAPRKIKIITIYIKIKKSELLATYRGGNSHFLANTYIFVIEYACLSVMYNIYINYNI